MRNDFKDVFSRSHHNIGTSVKETKCSSSLFTEMQIFKVQNKVIHVISEFDMIISFDGR